MGLKFQETNAAVESKMSQSGFIIASINKKDIKQAVGLESHVVRYTPVLGDNQEIVLESFKEAFPDHIIVITMPVEALKQNIEVLDSLSQKRKNTP